MMTSSPMHWKCVVVALCQLVSNGARDTYIVNMETKTQDHSNPEFNVQYFHLDNPDYDTGEIKAAIDPQEMMQKVGETSGNDGEAGGENVGSTAG